VLPIAQNFSDASIILSDLPVAYWIMEVFSCF
jgi:hypothetical protein